MKRSKPCTQGLVALSTIHTGAWKILSKGRLAEEGVEDTSTNNFDGKANAIKEAKDLSTYTMEELIGNL